MLLTINIPQKAATIIRQTDKISSESNISATSVRRFSSAIRDFILTMEGFGFHIATLDKNETKKLIDQCNKIINIFINIDDELSAKKYFDGKAIEEMFKYALKTLYKLKSLLHIQFTKDKEVIQTTSELKIALSAISREAVFHQLSK